MAREEYRELLVALTGGLNTSSDPAELAADELAEAIGMEYRPPNIGLFAVAGRSQFDSGVKMGGAKVQGLIYAGFDTTASATIGPRLIAFSGGSAFGATVTGGGTNQFTAVKRNLTETDYADGCHYGNDWFFWNGKDDSWSVRGTNLVASAVHGTKPVAGTYTVEATSLAAASNTIGTFDVWVTEYLGDNPNSANGEYTGAGIPTYEGAITSLIQSVTLSATAMAIRLTFPSAVANAANNPDGNLDEYWFHPYCSLAGGKFPYGYTVGGGLSAQAGRAYRASAYAGLTTDATAAVDRHLVPKESVIIGWAPYPVVQPIGGVGVSSNGAPPKPYAMTVFQDSLVAIDRDDRQILKYSMPDDPHAWPSTYFIPFETEQQDDLTALAVCNNALLVFSSSYGYRLEDLPRATDGEDVFSSRSRAKERFSDSHGCVGPRAAAVFNIFGSGDLCLFVCRDGIHITDGFKTDYASPTIDWPATVDLSNLYRCKLLNNPKKHRVEFYYPLYTATPGPSSWRRLDFYYYPSLLKQSGAGFPRLPVLGPTKAPGPSATLGLTTVLNSLSGAQRDDWQVWCGSDNADSVWTEATGTVDNLLLVDASGTVEKSWKTKTFYPVGFNGEAELLNIYTHQSQTTASGSYTVTGTFGVDDEQSPFTATATVDNTLKGAMPHPDLRNRAQWFNLRGAKNDGGAWQEMNSITFIVQRPSRVESGKSNV